MQLLYKKNEYTKKKKKRVKNPIKIDGKMMAHSQVCKIKKTLET